MTCPHAGGSRASAKCRRMRNAAEGPRKGAGVPSVFVPGGAMRNEFTAIIEPEGEWFVAYCPEIPGANGQGRSIAECRTSLGEAIALILQDRREDGLRGVPADAIRETVTVE